MGLAAVSNEIDVGEALDAVDAVDRTGSIRAWHTVEPRSRRNGRVPKAPTLADLDRGRTRNEDERE